MKKVISMALTASMLLSAFPATLARADETSTTLKEYFSYDFDTDAADFEKLVGYGNTFAGKSYETGKAKEDNDVYGIGGYRYVTSNAVLPLVVDTSSETPVLSGVERLTEPNKYLEIEYDYKPIAQDTTKVGSGYGGFGIGGVASDCLTTGTNFFGSLYHMYNSSTTKAWYGFEMGEKPETYPYSVDPEMGTWHRVKIVTQLTTGTLQDGSETLYTMPNAKCIKTYMDGELISEKYYKSSTLTLTDEYVRAVRLHASYGRAGVDNLTVRTYLKGDEPVDKSVLVTKIREFEAKYTAYTDHADAVTYIDAAKAVYKNADATEEDVDSAFLNIEAAEDIVNPRPKTYFEYDFETAEDIAAFKEAVSATGSSTSGIKSATDDQYGIGTYIKVSSGHPYIAITPEVSRTASENMYIEAEFDLMPVEPTATQLASANGGNRAAIYFTNEDNKSNAMAGIECNYAKETNKECLNAALDGQKLKAFEYGKWYRCKVVCLLNDNGSITNKTGLVKFYIDGNLVGTDDYYKNYETINYLRIYENWSSIAVDNLSVKTYTAENPAPDKASLVTKIREFIKYYPNYADNAEALALFNQACEIYNSDETTVADITTAEGYLTQAQRAIFNAEPLIKENFNNQPESFFDTTDASGSYESDDTYAIDYALSMPASTSSKSFEAVALGGDCAYVTAEADVKVNGNAELKLGDSVAYTLNSDGTAWNRVRFDIDTVGSTYDVYVNGEEKVTAQAITDTELSALTVTADAEYVLDNVAVYSFEDTADVVSDKGALVTELRAAKALLDADTMTADEAALMETVFEKYGIVYDSPNALTAAITNATERMAFYNENLSAQMDGAQSVVIPGVGRDVENMQVHLNLHYGSQQGNEAYDDIFFDKNVDKSFSNVRFYNTDGEAVQSHINSTGNYEFIEDDALPKTRMLKTQDGKVVAKRNGFVQISEDMGVTWTNLGSGFRTENVYMVDDDNNIWHFRDDASVDGPAEIYKIYAPDYTEEKLMIDTSQLWGLYNNWDSSNVDEDYDVDDATFTMNYDEDGYVYVGLYQTEWTGCTVYVSDSDGENFVVADFRPDKQHVHAISVNKNVYPNEVYISMDDSLRKPLCYVTTDHLGYEEIKDDPDHQLPCKARSTGGMELFLSTDDEHPDKYMPKNEAAENILAHSKQHVTQVPVPFGNPDYMGRWTGLIEDRETAPDKFEYNEEMGKWYTIKNKEYYNEVSGKTHYYSDNVYAIGFGEANILGGPGAYKTTDIMNPDAYYPIIKSTHGARRTVSPADGILLWGGLSGGFAQNASLAVSYDDGETWTEAYTYGYDFSLDAGNGAFRYMDGPWEMSDGTTQMLMYGYGDQPSMRGIFGGDNYFALSSVLLPELPEDGIKIFVNTDGDVKQPVTKYYYGTADDTAVINSVKSSEGESEVLKFPLVGQAHNMIYRYDIATEADTAVEANLIASTSKGTQSVMKMFFDTLNGTVSLNDTEAIANDAVASGKFSVKLITDENGVGKLYINDSYVGEAALKYEYKKLASLTYKTVDVSGGTAASIAEPVTVSYSNVGYGEYSTEGSQFLLEAMTMEKDGASVDALTNGAELKSVKVSKIDTEIDNAVFISALYDGGKLHKVVFTDITGSGAYPVGLTADKDDLELRCFIFKDMQTIKPVILNDITDMAVEVGFDLSGTEDAEVITVKESNQKPFSEKAAATEVPFYMNNDVVEPVFRMKFDEGEGNTVTESVSGKTYTIEGGNHEWVNDAEIRFGTTTPHAIRQKSALRLNDSYINLGNVEALAGLGDEFTVSFWTNFEVAGRNDDYEEPAHHVLSGVKTYGSFGSAYKYEVGRKNVIFTSDTTKLALAAGTKYADMSFDGVSTKTSRLPMPAVETDFYNMYNLVVKKNDSGTWTTYIYGNDKPAPQSGGATLDSANIFDGNLYIGIPSAEGKFASSQLGIADIMVFDKALSYQERLELYYGYRQPGYYEEEPLSY